MSNSIAAESRRIRRNTLIASESLKNKVCFRIKLFQVTDIIPAKGLGTRDCYIKLSNNEHELESSKVMDSCEPRWSPPEEFIVPIVNEAKDKCVVTLMDNDMWWDDVEIGYFVLKPSTYIEKKPGEKTREDIHFHASGSGQQISTYAQIEVEVIPSALASMSEEQRVYEYERYTPFVGWAGKNLKTKEAKYVSGDLTRTGATFEEAAPVMPDGFVEVQSWAPVPVTDKEGWMFASDYNATNWYHENSVTSSVRRRLYVRKVQHSTLEGILASGGNTRFGFG